MGMMIKSKAAPFEGNSLLNEEGDSYSTATVVN